jgi:hypothetical protein
MGDMGRLSFSSVCVVGFCSALIGIAMPAHVKLTQVDSLHDAGYTTSLQRHVIFCQDPGAGSNYLNGITVISPSDIWAVGAFYPSMRDGFYHSFTLTEHWDGKKWTTVPSPDPPGPAHTGLEGVTSITTDDVWAVGSFQSDTEPRRALIEHWDGKKWSIVANPNTPTLGVGELRAITAISPDNLWAVGGYWIEHWDGRAWTIVPRPNVTGEYTVTEQLESISAISTTNIWAVGSYRINGPGSSKILILHWDGKSWSRSPVPSTDLEQFSVLHGVVTLSNGEAWAVGEHTTYSPNAEIQVKSLIMHWDGKQWSIAPSPNPGIRNNLTAVAARSPNDIWAVGNSNDQTTILIHWDGRAWYSATNPKTRPSFNRLLGIAIASPYEIWAAGYFYTDETRYETLTEQYTVPH